MPHRETNSVQLECQTTALTVTHRFPFLVHDGLQFLKVSQFDLELLHLCLDQQSDQTLDLAFLDRRQVLEQHDTTARH